MHFKLNSVFAYASAALLASVATAAPISVTPNLIIFGNSLSDTGNSAALTRTPTYWEGRYSNSYVWNEYTAKLLGMNLINKAYGGATSNNEFSPAAFGDVVIPSLHDQVTMWLQQNANPSKYNLENDVIEIEIGGNDVLHRAKGLLAGTIDPTTFAHELTTSIATDIKTLIDAGYKNINLWNLPALNKTPSIASLGAGSQVATLVTTLNTAIKTAIEGVAAISNAKGVHVFDIGSLMTVALQDNVLASLGINNPTDACYSQDASGAVSVCTNPDEYFFYDSIHPASRMHYLWGIVAAALTRDPNTVIDTAEVLKLISIFGINQSNREDNIIVDGLTPSESSAINAPSVTATNTDTYATTTPTSNVYVTPIYTITTPATSTVIKCQ
ncbi:GDSL-like Lipase/Acylhydrolase-domain-containing protein [Kickxella alabastrina]|uniref:GDSL-like Lipase/Acylhydrolase-domain-containing protein n=1 Tax=Kickxella alabastrina TaxID=61397 RepID=UPI00221F44C7|nr:GDSL-like Lipase/Acylhydrolase-domain-containing protein [Kickxella alabastrina]KAI7834046.1 GDSL-like Lipase/Acylhydrolase-domain-containing protein [Kickxella alabastrina]